MELFKGLTQEEFKELRSIIIDIGLIMHYGIKDWRCYVVTNFNSKLHPHIRNLLKQSDHNMDLIIQGVLNE